MTSHPFHLVHPSPWPLTVSLGAGMMTLGVVLSLHVHSSLIPLLGTLAVAGTAVQWWRDISREATMLGDHTLWVQWNMRWGMALFIVSEVMFFFSFFWAYFHLSLAPTVETGLSWPPTGAYPPNPLGMPLLNTVILLSSGLAVTWSHHAMINSELSPARWGLILTIIMGAYFLGVQAIEYSESPFSIADSAFGSIFFVATGFHGLHVCIGLIMLLVAFYRMQSGHYSSGHHFGFEASAWYWHFVDVVWVFLFAWVYYWSGS